MSDDVEVLPGISVTLGPYAGFKPEQDPYLKSIPKQTDLSGQGGPNYLKGWAAGLGGLPGEIHGAVKGAAAAAKLIDMTVDDQNAMNR